MDWLRRYYYRAGYQERAEATFIAKSSAAAVAEWFKARWFPPTSQEVTKYYFDQQSYKLLEHIALRRREPVIDYAIAKWGFNLAYIQRVYDRSGGANRSACLSNLRAGHLLNQTVDIIRSGKLVNVEAILQNPHLPADFVCDLLKRRGSFEGLDDDRFISVLVQLGGNKRLSSEYTGYMDGMAEASFESVFYALGELVLTVPATKPWSHVLWGLLDRGICRIPKERLPEALQRWRVDEPATEPVAPYQRGASLRVRELIASSMNADAQLIASDDLALRLSFYRRFLPGKFPKWDEFTERDGADFVDAALKNPHLWKTSDLRDQLQRSAWSCPDPKHLMDLPNAFKIDEQRQRREHPEWFDDELVETIPAPPKVIEVLQELVRGLDTVAKRLAALEGQVGRNVVSGNVRWHGSYGSPIRDQSTINFGEGLG